MDNNIYIMDNNINIIDTNLSSVLQPSPKRLRESSNLFDEENDDDDYVNSLRLNVETDDDIQYFSKKSPKSPKRTKLRDTLDIDHDDDMETVDIDPEMETVDIDPEMETFDIDEQVTSHHFNPHPIYADAVTDHQSNITEQENIEIGNFVDMEETPIDIVENLMYPRYFNYPHISTIGTGLQITPGIGDSVLMEKNITFLNNRQKEGDTSNGLYPSTVFLPKNIATFSNDSIVSNISSDAQFIQLGPLAPLPKEFLLNPREYWGMLQSRGWYSIKTPDIMQSGFCYKDIDDEYVKKRFGSNLFLRRGEPRILQESDEYIEKIYETSEMNINLFNNLFKEDICFPSEDSVINYCRSTYGIGMNNFPNNTEAPAFNSMNSVISFLFPNNQGNIPN